MKYSTVYETSDLYQKQDKSAVCGALSPKPNLLLGKMYIFIKGSQIHSFISLRYVVTS